MYIMCIHTHRVRKEKGLVTVVYGTYVTTTIVVELIKLQCTVANQITVSSLYDINHVVCTMNNRITMETK